MSAREGSGEEHRPPTTEAVIDAVRHLLLEAAGYSYHAAYRGADPEQLRTLAELLEPAELMVADLRRAVQGRLEGKDP